MFNYRASMPVALRSVIARTRAEVVVASYNDESWMRPEEIADAPSPRPGTSGVEVLGFDSKRYVGAQIGVHNLRGERVGEVGHLRNTEFLFLAGPMTWSRPRSRQRARTAPVTTG